MSDSFEINYGDKGQRVNLGPIEVGRFIYIEGTTFFHPSSSHGAVIVDSSELRAIADKLDQLNETKND